MKIAYTICSANYLPFAKSLADSFIQHNPGYQFVIALADRFRDYNRSFFSPHQIIPVEEMQISPLEEMNAQYSLFELSCALKPFVAGYLFNTYSNCTHLFYFDSDILVFDHLADAESALHHHSIVLTPHISSPPPADLENTELDVLRTGLYNAGFFGIKRSDTTTKFLNWWKEKLLRYCFNDALHGLFVDQLWLDLVPIYFRDTHILYNAGYNLAYWNFFERSISKEQNTYMINGSPLVFFHYSGYDFVNPNFISKHQKSFTLDAFPLFKPLFDQYISVVKENDAADYLSLPPNMGKPVLTPTVGANRKNLKQKLKQLFNRSNR